MQILKIGFFIQAIILCLGQSLIAQDSTASDGKIIRSQIIEDIGKRAGKMKKKLDRQSRKAIAQFQRQEEIVSRTLSTPKDSSKAKEWIESSRHSYEQMERQLAQIAKPPYIPKLDTLLTSLQFIDQHKEYINVAKGAQHKLNDALENVKGLQNEFAKAEIIKKFISERKKLLKDQLASLGLTKQLKKLNKQVYYYSQQVNEYKELLQDSKKAERKAFELLSKTKMFKDFMRKNSQLAQLFRIPGLPDDLVSLASLNGLQTRVQVSQLIQNQITAGGPGAREQFQQNLQGAQAQLNQLKDKINQLGVSSNDLEMPDFTPNNQKTKSFLKRLELGTMMQTQKANSIFPVTSDIGLSVGYKLNDKSIIGIGSNVKMGWGTGWNRIRISSQGVGLRSFVDYKLKGSFWISGGFEMNYRSEIRKVEQLRDYSAWQQSGLVGMSKVVSSRSNLFKKTKLQLLWDFLSYRQLPRSQPVIFRINYNLK